MELTILFATTDREEHAGFREQIERSELPYRVLFPDTVSRVDALIRDEGVDIIVTDLLFQNGGFADWLFLWPMPFVLLADYKDSRRIDEIIKDEACGFLIRDAERNYLSVLPIMIRKVLNNRESIERQNMHIQISERRYLDLVQALPDVIFTLDHDGYFTFVNESVRGFGYDPVELIGKHFSCILDPEDVSRISRKEMLKSYSGVTTGPEKAPKLFDERRTGNRKTTDLEVKIKPKQTEGEAGSALGSVISYGEVSAVGFSSLSREAGDPGSAGIIRDITERKKAEDALRDSLHEKEVLLKEIHHRVKNNLQIITSLLSLQSSFIRDPEDLRLFEDSQMQVRSMAMVHEQLYQSERLSRINMRIYLRSLCEKLYDVYRVSPSRITLDIDSEEIFYDVEAATPLALLVNELVSNSLKYAFPENRKGKVTVSMKMHETFCKLTVADDGVGLSADLDLSDSRTLGCRLISALVDQISGSIEHCPGPGTVFTVKFPFKEDLPVF